MSVCVCACVCDVFNVYCVVFSSDFHRLTLDTNTAHTDLYLSDNNRKVDCVWDDDPTLRTLDPPPAAVADAAPTLAGCSNTLSGVGGTLAQPPVSEAGCGGE